MASKIRIGILANEIRDDHQLWVLACEKRSADVEYKIINMVASNWMEEVLRWDADCYVAKPAGITSRFKKMYDERIYTMVHYMNLPVYPTLDEILVHENKILLSYFLKAKQIPHPGTHIFYDKEEAISFIKNTALPLVAKTSIGASGSGVKIIKEKSEGIAYIQKAFSSKGAPKRWGPNMMKGDLIKRGMRYLKDKQAAKDKLNKYKAVRGDAQKGYAIFQEFVPHSFEWRCVHIGDSYFAHKKLVIGEKASGSLLKGYDNPPLSLMDFLEETCNKAGFISQAVDVFEGKEGRYLVNEMQAFFGQSDPYQMKVNDVVGRYVRKNGSWLFEAGDFNTNQSYDLRLDSVIKLHTNSHKLQKELSL